MTVYYRGPCAHITDDLLEVWSPEYRVFQIGALESVYVVHGRARHGGNGSLFLTAGAVVAAILGPQSAWFAVLAALLAAGAAALAAVPSAMSHPYELYGSHRGAEVLLFRCADARTFGQVRRALARAIERHAEEEWRASY